MRVRWLMWCVLSGCLCPVTGGLARAAEPAPEPPKTFDVKAIDAYLSGQVKAKGFVGLSVAILKDGKLVLARGYGRRALGDGDMTPETLLAAGSVTKQFTCACVLLL